MKKLYLAFVCNLLLLAATAQPCSSNRYKTAVFDSVILTQDVFFGSAVPYGSSSPQNLFMDIYEPAGDTLRFRPFIIFAFGGGFLGGDKRQPNIPEFCETFAKRGYVVAAIDYRTGFNVILSSSAERAVYRGVQDLRAATRFLAQQENVYRIDTSRLIYTGTSAGCFSGLHSAFMSIPEIPSSYRGTSFESDNLGHIDSSGNNYYFNQELRPMAILNQWGAILDTSFIDYGKFDSVPVISFHGDNDNAVPYNVGHPFAYPVFPTVYGSNPIHQQLNRLGIPNKLVTLSGYGHEPQLANVDLRDTIFKHGTAFLSDLLKPKTINIVGDLTICRGDTAIYQALSYDRQGAFCWFLPAEADFVSQNGNEVKLVWNTAGTHQLACIEHNRNQAFGDTIWQEVSIIEIPIAHFVSNKDELQVVFSNSSSLASSFQWFFGDGTSSNGTNPTHIYGDTGTYVVSLLASNGYCADTFIETIHLYHCPQANFYDLVSGTDVYLFNTSTYYDSLYWSFGDGNFSNDLNPVHQYFSSGTYTVKLYCFWDALCADSMSLQINMIGTSVTSFNKDDFHLEIFPNPVQSKVLEVRFNSSESQMLYLVDMNGKLVQKNDKFYSGDKLNLSNVSAGNYILKVGNAQTSLSIY